MRLFIILFLGLLIGLNTSLRAVQTDTHTYIVSTKGNKVLTINRGTGEEKFIKVGGHPQHMVIHGNWGYVVNRGSNSISVIDLQNQTVTKTINVGRHPQHMVTHGDFGYVVNKLSYNVSVLDLKTNTVAQTIDLGGDPTHMVIHEDFGYVVLERRDYVFVIDLQTHTIKDTIQVDSVPKHIMIHKNCGYMGNQVYVGNEFTNNVSVLDLKTNTVIKTITVAWNPELIVIHGQGGYVINSSLVINVLDLTTNSVIRVLTSGNFKDHNIDFSDTHVYLGIIKLEPRYPTLASLQRMKTEGSLGEFANMNAEAFNVGEVKPRDYPKNKNQFDELPVYILAYEIFWDVDTDKPIIDPVDILATLVTMKYPQKFLQSKDLGPWLRNRLHMAFFQAVWLGQNEKAQKMLRCFIQLEDPVITKLATYTLVKPKAKVSGATNSTSK